MKSFSPFYYIFSLFHRIESYFSRATIVRRRAFPFPTNELFPYFGFFCITGIALLSTLPNTFSYILLTFRSNLYFLLL